MSAMTMTAAAALPFTVQRIDHVVLQPHALPHSDKAQINFSAEGDGPSAYFSDPDGNQVELKGPCTSRQ